ncbi:MAG: anthranilate synthase component I [Chthoniobacterales bacterium]
MRPSFSPSLHEFLRVSNDFNVVTVWCELVADFETPVSAYQKLGTAAPNFLFESAEQGDHAGRYSFVGSGARWTMTARGRSMRVVEGADVSEYETKTDPLKELESRMSGYRIAPQEGLPEFRGGAVGYLSYDAVRWFEPTVDAPPKDELGVPDLFYLLPETIVAFDHRMRRMKVMANAYVEGDDREANYADAVSRILTVMRKLEQPLAVKPMFTSASSVNPIAPVSSEPRANTTRDEYFEMVERAKEYIRAGDIFQMVPSQRFETEFSGDPLDLYRSLRFVNPSPYLFCLRVEEGFSIVGSSPEVHVKVTDGLIEIRPLAGTRKRGESEAEDLALEEELLADPKERAEHLMLVDLARNDVGRIAEFGSVRVDDFMTVERYSHVMHIVSHVSGQLAGGRSGFDVMRATFPAGTVSGSPKVRAMQIINELERSKRCVYSGAVGYFGFDGNLDSCIALRTIVLKDRVAYVQAGGGLVADSTAQGEYDESVNKAKAAMRAVALANHFGSDPESGAGMDNPKSEIRNPK